MNIDSIQSTTTLLPRVPSQESTGSVAPLAAPRQNVVNETAMQSNAPPKQADKATLEHAVQRISDHVSATRPEINFSIDSASGTHVVKIVDSQSKEVIRQIPSEEAIQIAQALDKLQGLFVKGQA